jgi:hypothetical protein
MTILHEFRLPGNLGHPQCVQSFAMEQLISCASGDLRWAVMALAVRLLAAVGAFAQKQAALLVRSFMHRAWQGACFAGRLTPADTMVAAGGR